MKIDKKLLEKRQQTLKRVRIHRGINQILAEQNKEIQRQLKERARTEQRETMDIDQISFDENDHSQNNQERQELEKLRAWSIEYNIARRALNDLLKLLVSFGLDLPIDSRTLMQTPKSVNISDVANGKFWFNGLECNLRRILNKVNRDMNISLNINIDGLPLFNSSKIQMWPILINLNGDQCADIIYRLIVLIKSPLKI